MSTILRRFLGAYLAAALSATAVVLVGQAIWVLAADLGTSAFHDVGGALIFGFYSLGFTLVLGLSGWGLLRLVGRTGWLPFASIGAALGLLAGWYVADGFTGTIRSFTRFPLLV